MYAPSSHPPPTRHEEQKISLCHIYTNVADAASTDQIFFSTMNDLNNNAASAVVEDTETAASQTSTLTPSVRSVTDEKLRVFEALIRQQGEELEAWDRSTSDRLTRIETRLAARLESMEKYCQQVAEKERVMEKYCQQVAENERQLNASLAELQARMNQLMSVMETLAAQTPNFFSPPQSTHETESILDTIQE